MTPNTPAIKMIDFFFLSIFISYEVTLVRDSDLNNTLYGEITVNSEEGIHNHQLPSAEHSVLVLCGCHY